MRILYAAAMIAVLTAPAFAQSKPVPRYGQEDKAKTASELESEKQAEAAYRRSLSNVPDAGPVDPWGSVRTPPASKSAAPKVKSAN